MKTTSINELVDMATSMGIEDVGRLKKQDIIFRIVKQKASEGEDVFGGGVLEILNDGFGFFEISGRLILRWTRRYLCFSKPSEKVWSQKGRSCNWKD